MQHIVVKLSVLGLRLRLLLAVFCFLLLVSCGGSEKQINKQIESVGTESALKERVNSRWEDLKQRRLDKVYEYYSPEYRKLHSLEEFKSSIGVSVEWVAVVINKVSIEGKHAKVQTNITYRLRLPGAIGEQFGAEMGEIDKAGSENWVWRTGQWWFADEIKKGL